MGGGSGHVFPRDPNRISQTGRDAGLLQPTPHRDRGCMYSTGSLAPERHQGPREPRTHHAPDRSFRV